MDMFRESKHLQATDQLCQQHFPKRLEVPHKAAIYVHVRMQVHRNPLHHPKKFLSLTYAAPQMIPSNVKMEFKKSWRLPQNLYYVDTVQIGPPFFHTLKHSTHTRELLKLRVSEIDF